MRTLQTPPEHDPPTLRPSETDRPASLGYASSMPRRADHSEAYADHSFTEEQERGSLPGGLGVFLFWVLFPLMGLYLVYSALAAKNGFAGGGAFLLFIAWMVLVNGFFVVEPNGSKVLMLFGKYKGTVKQNGFFYTLPFMSKRSISLRARTLNGEKLKVNDAAGNPIEIAAIIVWKVRDTYRACFEVDDYEEYVRLQSETAVRHLASAHPYDADDHEMSLRRNTDEVARALRSELDERLARAGVQVLEARLSHLAYAPEIAGAMLRRQQATAVIAARQKIVEGAVSMVEMALGRLEEHKIVNMDDDRKAAMVSNLLVVLCGEQAATPIVNAGASATGGVAGPKHGG